MIMSLADTGIQNLLQKPNLNSVLAQPNSGRTRLSLRLLIVFGLLEKERISMSLDWRVVDQEKAIYEKRHCQFVQKNVR